VESGPIGVLGVIAPFAYGLVICYRSNTRLALAVAVALTALALAGMGHDVARRFEFQLPLYFLLAIVSMESRREMDASSAATTEHRSALEERR